VGLGTLDVRPFRLLHPSPGRAQRRHETAGWQARGRDLVTAPALYLVTLTTGTKSIRAIAISLMVGDSLRSAGLLPHEAVHPPAVNRRLKSLRAARVDREPVLLTHPGGGLAVAAAARDPQPLLYLTYADLTVEVARIGEADAEIVMADLGRRSCLVADGHHRLAAAMAHRAQCVARRQAQESQRRQDEPTGQDLLLDAPDNDCGLVTALVVDSDDTPLTINPIHRVLHRRGPQPLQLDEVVAALRATQPSLQSTSVHPDQAEPSPSGVVLSRSSELVVRDRAASTTLWCPPVPAAGLPTSAHVVEAAAAGLPGTTMRRLRESDRVLAATQRRGTVAVLFQALTHNEIFDAISHGDLLPVKATSFEPKLPAGVLIRPIDHC